MILFFDTETTGFYKDRLPFDHPDQPRLVQFAAQLTDEDGEMVSQVSLIVNPEMDIPKAASDVHGVSTKLAAQVGVTQNSALGLFCFLASRASFVVAHNIKFDVGVMSCAAARKGGPMPHFDEICTMEEASPHINLPPTERMIAAGINKPKSPKLEECTQHFFGEPLDGAHDALIDVQACARVYFHLKSKDLIGQNGDTS